MTTIDILGASPRGRVIAAAPATRLRLTVRGRRVLAFLASIPVIVALGIGIVSGGGALASNEGSSGSHVHPRHGSAGRHALVDRTRGRT